jgi:hypothetical protein
MANKDVLITIKALDKTKKAFGGITKGLKVVAGAALNLKTAFVGVAGAAGIGLLIKRSLDATDALAKTATRIGTTTEALSRLHFAAEISGVSTETLNMAMQRFTRRTAEAARGTGEAKDAIRELGLNANNLLQLDLDERMIKLAEAFAAQEDPARKVVLAMKLFDSEGVALLQTLDAGAAGLRAMFDEAELLGAVMSTDAAKGVEDTKDEMTRLGAVMSGLVAQVTAALAPAIGGFTEKITEMMKEVAASKGGFREFARSLAKNVLGTLLDIIRGAAQMANGFISALNKINAARIEFMRIFGLGIIGEQQKIEAAIANVEKATGQMARNRSGKLKELRSELAQLKQTAEDAGLSLDSNLVELIDVDEFGFGIQEILKDAIGSLSVPIELGTGEDGTGKTVEGISAITQAWGGAQEALKKFNATNEDVRTKMEAFTTETLASFSDALTNAVMGTGNLKDAFKAMIANMIKQLIQFFIIDRLTGGIASALFSLKGATKGPLGAPMGNGSNVRGYAAIGGPVQSGSPYMVGERGPEMFVPNQSGSIIPNKSMGGGITVVNNVDARGSGADVDQKIKSAMAQTSQQTIITIQDLMRRRRFA